MIDIFMRFFDRFTRIGIEHHDLFFDDGSVPSMDILLSFLRITETAPAAVAVHCKVHSIIK
jgi:cell division cycle 14